MSSTNRGYSRHKSDYYVTPVGAILEFLQEFKRLEPQVFSENNLFLDCCAGGSVNEPMSYPLALSQMTLNHVETIDIREDSLAETIGDYTEIKLDYKPDVIITNPPFNQAREIIEKALHDVADGGFVIMLLRLNFFGSKRRRDMWEQQMPKYSFVHSQRMSFTDDGKTDSIEYQHLVWQKGYLTDHTELRVI